YAATLLYGVVRALVAVVFALLMYLLVLGGVLLPEVARESFSRVLVLAFVAGCSGLNMTCIQGGMGLVFRLVYSFSHAPRPPLPPDGGGVGKSLCLGR